MFQFCPSSFGLYLYDTGVIHGIKMEENWKISSPLFKNRYVCCLTLITSALSSSFYFRLELRMSSLLYTDYVRELSTCIPVKLL